MHSKNSVAREAIVAYVPALHAGYLSFLTKHPNAHIFVLGKSARNAFPRLDRDLRALAPDHVVTALRALGFIADVIEATDAQKLHGYKTIILPDEDVSRDFADKHLPNRTVSFESVFLRWDGVFANKQNEVSPDRIITTDTLHQELMRRALKESQKSPDWWRQIGAVLVKNNEIVAVAHTYHPPSDLVFDILGTPRITVDFGERPDLYISLHSEAGLIAQAAREGIILKGTSLYVTTFPCVNCAYLIAQSGITMLYYAQGYSNLNGEEVLKSTGVEIIFVQGV